MFSGIIFNISINAKINKGVDCYIKIKKRKIRRV